MLDLFLESCHARQGMAKEMAKEIMVAGRAKQKDVIPLNSGGPGDRAAVKFRETMGNG